MLRYRTAIFVVFLTSLIPSGPSVSGAVAQSELPDKGAAIAFLEKVVDLLEANDYAATEKHFYLPPDFKSEMFDSLLKGKVISRDGVLALEKAGDFGSAHTIFGEKRAARKTEQAGVPSDQCFAFTMEQGGDENYASCEVIMHWTEDRFKIVDIRGVGRMASADVVENEAVAVKEWPIATGATSDLLLESLSVLLHHIENGHYDEAKTKLYVPDDFTVSKLKGIIERRELSAEGIEVMRQSGKYGPASDVFGADRATFFADRVNVPVAECYGMIATADATGETMAHWKGDHFKFLRADDIGKLNPKAVKGQAAESKPAESKPAESKPAESKTAESKTAESKTAESMSPKVTKQESAEPVAKPSESQAIFYETDREKVALGLAALKASVEANPEDALLRVRFARNWLVLGNPIEAWKQLRQAINDSAEGSVARREAMRGIDETLESLNGMGIFQNGVPQQTMIELLGEPARKTGGDDGRWVYPGCSIDFTDRRITKITMQKLPAIEVEEVGDPVSEESGFALEIKSFSGSRLAAIRAIRAVKPVSLGEAVKIVDALPHTYQDGLSKTAAESAKQALQEDGWEVEIVPSSN